MYSKIISTVLFVLLLASCSGRQIDILDDNKIVGECYAGVDWHFYGMQDTIDYMLYECAKESIEQGKTLSDKSLLKLDFTLPTLPEGYAVWNKKLAMYHYRNDDITEQKLGYILAAIELTYMKIVWPARDALAEGKMSQHEFDKIEKSARFIWLGE